MIFLEKVARNFFNHFCQIFVRLDVILVFILSLKIIFGRLKDKLNLFNNLTVTDDEADEALLFCLEKSSAVQM